MARFVTKKIAAPAIAPASANTVSPESTRDQKAMELVNSYLPWSAGAGLVPMPGGDMLALTAAEPQKAA